MRGTTLTMTICNMPRITAQEICALNLQAFSITFLLYTYTIFRQFGQLCLQLGSILGDQWSLFRRDLIGIYFTMPQSSALSIHFIAFCHPLIQRQVVGVLFHFLSNTHHVFVGREDLIVGR